MNDRPNTDCENHVAMDMNFLTIRRRFVMHLKSWREFSSSLTLLKEAVSLDSANLC